MFDPSGSGVLTWREARSLLRALGMVDVFTEHVLRDCGVSSAPSSSVGLDYLEWTRLLECRHFHRALDAEDYRHLNVRVLTSAIAHLAAGRLGIDDIRSLRIAMDFVESGQRTGIPRTYTAVATTLQLAGRTVAPRRLQAWLREEGPRLTVPGHLLFHEMMGLYQRAEANDALVETDSFVELQQRWRAPPRRSVRGTFALGDDAVFLTPRRQREYVVESRAVAEERLVAAKHAQLQQQQQQQQQQQLEEGDSGTSAPRPATAPAGGRAPPPPAAASPLPGSAAGVRRPVSARPRAVGPGSGSSPRATVGDRTTMRLLSGYFERKERSDRQLRARMRTLRPGESMGPSILRNDDGHVLLRRLPSTLVDRRPRTARARPAQRDDADGRAGDFGGLLCVDTQHVAVQPKQRRRSAAGAPRSALPARSASSTGVRTPGRSGQRRQGKSHAWSGAQEWVVASSFAI